MDEIAFTVSLKLESLLLFPAAATKRISESELIAFSSAFFKIWYHARAVFLRSSTSLSRRDPRQVHLLCIPRECAVSSGYTGPGVVFDQVFKAFGAQQVLRNVSFCVPAGEALCILGRSGTGKSVTPSVLGQSIAGSFPLAFFQSMVQGVSIVLVHSSYVLGCGTSIGPIF